MANVKKTGQDYYVVDIMHVLKTLWRKVWIIAIVGILVAAIGFALAAFVITPKYSSSVMLYVNNSSFSLGDFEVSSSQITAARSLVETYIIILSSRTTLEQVIESAGVSYTYEELLDMIDANPVNETEVLQVTVTCEDAEEASNIANCIAIVLPDRIGKIISGATMETVDSAVPNPQKVSPSITRFTAIGLIIGVFISALAIAIGAIMDNTIHDDDYIMKTYDYPILAKIPDLVGGSDKKGYRYYNKYYKSYKTYATPSASVEADKKEDASK